MTEGPGESSPGVASFRVRAGASTKESEMKMFGKRIFGCLTVVAAVGLSGCAAKLAVRTLQPGPVSVGSTKTLLVLSGEGRRSGREAVINDLVRQTRARGYFQVQDRTEEGAEVKISGRTVTLTYPKGLQAGEMGIRVDVLGWDTTSATNTVEKTNAKGKKTTETVTTRTGKAVLGVTLFNKEGKALVAEKEYVGKIDTTDSNESDENVIKSAATQAVAKFLAEITPTTVVRYVQLDEDDEAQKPIVKTAQSGNLAQAKDDLQKYLQANANNAAATYNLAVLTDASGDYEAALTLYDQALTLGNKDFYSEARAACTKRKADAEALARK
jgi:hypothetical protein